MATPTEFPLFEGYNSTNASQLWNGTDDDKRQIHSVTYIFVWVALCNIVVFVVGMTGNVMVILVVLRIRDMRTSTNYYLTNLGIADLLVILICQPSAMLEFYSKDRWLIGEVMCKLVPCLENGVAHASVMTILVITVERYFAICFPLKNPGTFSGNNTWKIILGVWTVALVSTFPFALLTVEEDALFYDGTPCKVCRTKITYTWHYWYMIGIVVIFFVLPLCTLVVMYSKIIRQLYSDAIRIITKKDPCSANSLKNRKQVVRMLIGIITLFFVSIFPIRVVSLWMVFTPVVKQRELGIDGYMNLISFARLMLYVNSAGNPVIYSLTSTKFKRAFKRLFGKYEAQHFHTMSVRYSSLRRTVPENGNLKLTSNGATNMTLD